MAETVQNRLLIGQNLIRSLLIGLEVEPGKSRPVLGPDNNLENKRAPRNQKSIREHCLRHVESFHHKLDLHVAVR